MGEIPVPGLFTVKLSSENSSPLLIGFLATMDFRAMGIFFFSLGLGFFTPFPMAFSILRMEATMAFSSSGVTLCMRMRLEWKVKRSGKRLSRARSMAGISVSMVVLELGTIWPMR